MVRRQVGRADVSWQNRLDIVCNVLVSVPRRECEHHVEVRCVSDDTPMTDDRAILHQHRAMKRAPAYAPIATRDAPRHAPTARRCPKQLVRPCRLRMASLRLLQNISSGLYTRRIVVRDSARCVLIGVIKCVLRITLRSICNVRRASYVSAERDSANCRHATLPLLSTRLRPALLYAVCVLLDPRDPTKASCS